MIIKYYIKNKPYYIYILIETLKYNSSGLANYSLVVLVWSAGVGERSSNRNSACSVHGSFPGVVSILYQGDGCPL